MPERSLCQDVYFQISLAPKRKGEQEPRPLSLDHITKNINDSRRAFGNVHRFVRRAPDVNIKEVEAAVQQLMSARVIETRDHGYVLLEPCVIGAPNGLSSATLPSCSTSSSAILASTASS